MIYQRKTSDDQVTIMDQAVVVGDVTLGKGVSVWYNATLRGDDGAIVIGEGSNIQDNAVLHEDCVLGKHCTVGHSALVHGCTIGDNSLVGMAAKVFGGAQIGHHCFIAAGSLVTGTMDAPPCSMIMGSPARVVRPLTEEELHYLDESWEFYLEQSDIYRREHGLKPILEE